MTTAYITDQDVVVRSTHGRLIVTREREEIAELQLADLESLHIFGHTEITTPALHKLMESGIWVSFYTIYGEFLGRLAPPATKNVQLRLRQYELHREPAFVLQMARKLISQKVSALVDILAQGRRNFLDPSLDEPIDRLRNLEEKVALASSVPELLGIEGASAAVYFPAFGKLFGRGFVLTERERQPPPDPVNSLLSLGYVTVGSRIQSLLDGIGLDPYIGFLHIPQDRRPSLALDLLEPFRPDLVDRFTLRLVNLGTVTLEDFQEVEGKGVRLTREGIKKYFAAFEKMLATPYKRDNVELTWQEWLRVSVENMASAIRNA